MIVKPDLQSLPDGYPNANFNNDDVWTLWVDGIEVIYTVNTNVDAGVAAALADAIGSQVASVDAVAIGDTVKITKSGNLAIVRDLKQTRETPYSKTDMPEDPARGHFFQVLFTLDGDPLDENEVRTDEKFVVILNGEEIIYEVPHYLVTGTSPGERNLFTVATGIVTNINTLSDFYTAEIDSSNPITIRINDRNVTGTGAGHGIDPFTFSAERGGEVRVVLDIDNTTLVNGSFEVFTGYKRVLAYYLFGIFPMYKTVPTFETVTYTISPVIELIDPDTFNPATIDPETGRPEVLAYDWYQGPANRVVDKGSNSFFDPFIDFFIPAPAVWYDSGPDQYKQYLVRISSVINYNKFFPQYIYPGVWGGLSYDMIISLPGHAENESAVELKGKILTIVEGEGKGQSAVIDGYEPETKAYKLLPVNPWTTVPSLDSRYEITTLLSIESGTPPDTDSYNGKYLLEAPVIDTYSVVLTAQPVSGKEVIVDVLPKLTRTYNADEAFNPDAAFGENKDEQVRVATDRALIELRGSAVVDEYWIVTLSRTNTTLSVDTLLENVFARLADGSLSQAELDELTGTNSDVVYYKVTAGNDLTDIAEGLRIGIDGLPDDYTVTMTPARTITLTGAAVTDDVWTLTLDDGTSEDYTYTVLPGDTLANVAAELAQKLNDFGTAGFSAEAKDGILIVLNPPVDPDLSGDDFTTVSIDVTASGGGAGSGSADITNTPRLLVTSSSSFYAASAIGIDHSGKVRPDTAGGATIEVTRDDSDLFDFVEVELTGQVAVDETWTLQLRDASQNNVWMGGNWQDVAIYPTDFRDDLALIARKMGEQIEEGSVLAGAIDFFDIVVRGRVLTISNATADQTKDIEARIVITPDSPGRAVITPQVLFDDSNWKEPQVVTVMAIDDQVIDGGDALVFPAFEERVNAIRGPLTIEGGTLVGAERFLNDPFRLPEETNEPQADGTINSVTTNANGQAVMYDHEAFHFNAVFGERPGFDPRMNKFPFEFTFLDGPAIGRFLDVASVSQEILSVGRDTPFTVDLKIDSVAPTDSQVLFSGTPEQLAIALGSTFLSWTEAVVSLTGAASIGETWEFRLDLDLDGTADHTFPFTVTPDSRALSKIVTTWADDINKAGGITVSAEALVDILGNAKVRITADDGTQFQVEVTAGSLGSAVVSGTPEQDYTKIFATEWTQAAFEMLSVSDGQTWDLNLNSAPTSYSYMIGTGETIEDLTFNLADRIASEFLPLVSGYEVTFELPWPSEVTSTVILSGTPRSGEVWSVQLDIAGTVKTFSHAVADGEPLEEDHRGAERNACSRRHVVRHADLQRRRWRRHDDAHLHGSS